MIAEKEKRRKVDCTKKYCRDNDRLDPLFVDCHVLDVDSQK
jgi:hypothetical protein